MSVTDDDGLLMPVNADLIAACDESDCDVNVSVRPAVTDGSPSTQRRKRLCKLRDSLKCRDNVDADRSTTDTDNIYTDNLPEVYTYSGAFVIWFCVL